MSKQRYSIGIIGCGSIALTGHLPAVLSHDRFELRGLCDIRTDRIDAALDAARRLAPGTEDGIAVDTDYRALLKNSPVDACILALHPEHSVAVACDLMQRGIAVLDEKPLAADIDNGMRVLRAVEEHAGVYQIGFCMRYSEVIQASIGWAKSVGAPGLYQLAIYDESLDQCQGEYGQMIQGILRHSSAITHEGSHIVDWMSLIRPSPIRAVKASATTTQEDFAGPNLWVCTLDYANGATLQFTIGWLLRNQPPSTIRLVGPDGWLELDLRTGKGQLAQGPRITPIQTAPLRQSWKKQLDAFAEAIERGQATLATAEDGMHALRTTLACEQSVSERRTIVL